MYKKRIIKIKKYLNKNKLDGLVVTSNTDIYYLTGFYSSTNDSLLYITVNNNYFITDGRYINQYQEQVKNFKLIVTKTNIYESLSNLIKGKNICDFENISHKNFLKINKQFEDSNNLIFNERKIKDLKEIKYIKKACKISQKALKSTLKKIKVGQSEIQIKNTLENEMIKYGSEYPAFSTIVAAGKNGASPHAIPTNYKVKKGDFITLDFGATYKNYCSDITRTISIGKPSQELMDVYKITLKAKKECEKYIKKGVKTSEIHKIANKIIEESNNAFLHSTGHGIGINIHELPSISKNSNEILKEGNVHTIEPGIYISGLGGVRIEDDYLITKNGYECLTNKITDDLIIL